ncbi:MAG: thymidine phosphorylase, partial [Gemmatimonadota bacterium]
MIPARVIEAKRDGETLGADLLQGFLEAYLRGEVPDYQMAAFLMAAYLQGLDDDETEVFVRCMLDSGSTLDLADLPGPRVDKHSTGGVGDKVSLVLAPLAAAMGLFVPMISGRGLGHTGGTLDKLEAIPGFQTDLSLSRFERVLREVGCAMIGQTAE